MTTPLEHYYIGLSETPGSSENNNNVLNLEETELRLGLPGSVSPGRKAENLVPLFGKFLEDTNVGGYYPFKNSVFGAKRGFSDAIHLAKSSVSGAKPGEEINTSPTNENAAAPASKAQVVGWPPIKSFRKNTLATNISKNADGVEGNSTSGCIYVKVSMDGAPYLRKVDLKTYCNYSQLSSGLENMFSCFSIERHDRPDN